MFFLIWRSHHTSDNPSFPNLLFHIKVWCVFPRLQRIWINLTFLALLFLASVLLFPRVHLVVRCEMSNNFCLSIIWTFVWSHPISYCLDRKVKKQKERKGGGDCMEILVCFDSSHYVTKKSEGNRRGSWGR